jgi:hypothetical protein
MSRRCINDIDKEALEKRMKIYYDSSIDWEAIENI